QGGIMELLAVRDARDSSRDPSGSSWDTLAEGTRIVKSPSIIGTDVSFAGCRNAWKWACEVIMSLPRLPPTVRSYGTLEPAAPPEAATITSQSRRSVQVNGQTASHGCATATSTTTMTATAMDNTPVKSERFPAASTSPPCPSLLRNNSRSSGGGVSQHHHRVTKAEAAVFLGAAASLLSNNNNNNNNSADFKFNKSTTDLGGDLSLQDRLNSLLEPAIVVTGRDSRLGDFPKRKSSLSAVAGEVPMANGIEGLEKKSRRQARVFEDLEKLKDAAALEEVDVVSEEDEEDFISSCSASSTSSHDEYTAELQMASVLGPSAVGFDLRPVSGMPAQLDVPAIYDAASRMLFLSVTWAKRLPAFAGKTLDEHAAVMRRCWCDLFMLGVAQRHREMQFGEILAAVSPLLEKAHSKDKITVEKLKEVTEHLLKMRAFVMAMNQMRVDDVEFAFLRALVLFSVDETVSDPGSQTWQVLQGLQAHFARSHPQRRDLAVMAARSRALRLLATLQQLRAVSSKVMEEIFFAGLIGDATIESLLPHILRTDTSDVIVNSFEKHQLNNYQNHGQSGGTVLDLRGNGSSHHHVHHKKFSAKMTSSRFAKPRTLNETVDRLRQNQLQNHLRRSTNDYGYSGDEESPSTPEQAEEDEGRLVIGEDEDESQNSDPGSMLETQVIEYPMDLAEDRRPNSS
ncbi:unnamed protein product, partial [Notodromas monacha]